MECMRDRPGGEKRERANVDHPFNEICYKEQKKKKKWDSLAARLQV